MTIELLSHLTGRNLTQDDITPPVRFLAALVTLGMGVMYADGVVQEEEKQLLEKTIERLVPPQRDVRQLVQRLLSGLEKNPVYQNPQQWLKLTTSLSESERILLLNFCYAMSAVDGTIDPNESEYLQLASNSLGIDSRYPVLMEAWFKGEEFRDQSVWEEFQSKLQPKRSTTERKWGPSLRFPMTSVVLCCPSRNTSKGPAPPRIELKRMLPLSR